MTFNIGDKVLVSDEGFEGMTGKVTGPGGDKWNDLGGIVWFVTLEGHDYSMPFFEIHLELIDQPRGILPGDRVQINTAGYEGCEGTVTYSKSDKGHPVVLITKDPHFDSLPDLKATGKCEAFKVDQLSRIIPQPENNLHEALDDLLFNL